MADTRGRFPVTVETPKYWRQRFISATAIAVCTTGALLYVHFHNSAVGSGQRTDRIDFSALATVVAIDDDAEWRSRQLNTGEKDDKLTGDLSFTSAATADMKSNLGEEPSPAGISRLVALHSAKLRDHLERGLMPEREAKDLAAVPPFNASSVALDPSMAVTPASLRQLKPTAGKLTNIKSTLGGTGKGPTGDGAASPAGGIRGSVSGLLH
jgi:hypothetical protein